MNGLSKRSILVCEECGQRTVLDGPLSAWCSGGVPFRCKCGEGKPTAELPLTQDQLGRSASSEAGIGGGEH